VGILERDSKQGSQLKLQHRDSLFHGFFKELENFLHLLNQCNSGDSLLTVDDIALFDLGSVVVIRKRRNDVSFITNDNRLIILVENQSTLCPNMAFRLFLYYYEAVIRFLRKGLSLQEVAETLQLTESQVL